MKYYVIKDCPGLRLGDYVEAYSSDGADILIGKGVCPPQYLAENYPEYFLPIKSDGVKRYKLLKPLFGIPVGALFEFSGSGNHSDCFPVIYGTNGELIFTLHHPYSQFPDWFEEIVA